MTPTPSHSVCWRRVCRSADSHVRSLPEGSRYETLFSLIHFDSSGFWGPLAIS
jgi:hypothetical protein